jgi:hypothetical protein
MPVIELGLTDSWLFVGSNSFLSEYRKSIYMSVDERNKPVLEYKWSKQDVGLIKFLVTVDV